MKTVLMLLLFATLIAPAWAGDAPIPKRFKPNQFAQVVDQIEQEMAPGGLYSTTSPEDQVKVRKSLGRMGEVLEGHNTIAELEEDQKIELINLQSEVNALLTGNVKEQLVCTRREIPGTKIPQSVCETKGEATVRTEEARKNIREMELRNPAYNN